MLKDQPVRPRQRNGRAIQISQDSQQVMHANIYSKYLYKFDY